MGLWWHLTDYKCSFCRRCLHFRGLWRWLDFLVGHEQWEYCLGCVCGFLWFLSICPYFTLTINPGVYKHYTCYRMVAVAWLSGWVKWNGWLGMCLVLTTMESRMSLLSCPAVCYVSRRSHCRWGPLWPRYPDVNTHRCSLVKSWHYNFKTYFLAL